MFAGFDFKIDSQENLINFSDYVIQGKNHLDSSKADQICSHTNPTAWLYKTLNNLIMRELHRSYHKEVALDEWNEARESMDIPMHLYLPTGLSEQDKELILLRIDKKLSFDEIAEYYGITNDACRQRLSRAIRKCRLLLDCEK